MGLGRSLGIGLCVGALPLLVLIAACTPGRSRSPSPPALATGEAVARFERIASVLTSPRCLNCHQIDAPLQGDDGHPHNPPVIRGVDGHGAPAMRCGNCHGAVANNPNSGVPGAPNWALAPLSMNWSGLSTGALCRAVVDPERNGHRTGADLIRHMDQDRLVLWGWDPGPGRKPVPIPHDEFVGLLKAWVADGSPCPA
jgi:hypothetical protein